MRRAPAIVLALLCLCLTACHRYLPEGEPAAPVGPADSAIDPGASADKPLELDVLNVEFVASGRDVDELLALKQTFPRALIYALGERNVKLGEVVVTFGASDEATAEAMKSHAVDIGFLSIETAMDHALEADALEQGDLPDLALTVLAQRGQLPAALTEALPDALSDLKDTLAHYTGAEQGGVFVPMTDEMRNNFARLYHTGETVLHAESTMPDGRDFELRGVGKRVNDYACGIHTIEVWDCADDKLLQTIEMTEAADDPNGGLDEYTSCPEPEHLFRTVDVNFDGYDDIEVFGWVPNNTIPYFYWLWENETQRYVYSFRLQGPTIDPAAQTLSAEYRESAALAWKDVYQWQDGELVLVSHEQIAE